MRWIESVRSSNKTQVPFSIWKPYLKDVWSSAYAENSWKKMNLYDKKKAFQKNHSFQNEMSNLQVWKIEKRYF